MVPVRARISPRSRGIAPSREGQISGRRPQQVGVNPRQDCRATTPAVRLHMTTLPAVGTLIAQMAHAGSNQAVLILLPPGGTLDV